MKYTMNLKFYTLITTNGTDFLSNTKDFLDERILLKWRL